MYKALKRLLRKNLAPIKLKLYAGNKYICPFCNYASRKLAFIGARRYVLEKYQVIGGTKRRGACMKCGSKDRERLIYIYLKEKTGIFSEKEISILHIAPEKHLMRKIIEKGLTHYVCGDLFFEGYSYPDNVINMDVRDLPFEEEKFDFIICNHVLEHINDDLKAIKEIFRVLKSKGQAILQVPISKNTYETFEDESIIDPEERTKVFGQRDHVRIYGQDYGDRLKTGGFKLKRVNISREYKEYGLNPDEDIFVAFK